MVDSWGDLMGKKELLRQVAEEIKNCRKCPLWKTRNKGVPGEGNPNAKLIFCGEAPGYWENQRGEPFVGRAGELLNKLLSSISIKRSEVFISNVLHCRPPSNRAPTQAEIKKCKPYLDRQLEIIKPKLVCALGVPATQTLLGKEVRMKNVHGQSIRTSRFSLFPTYHPAAALRNPNLEKVLREDFEKLKNLCEEKDIL